MASTTVNNYTELKAAVTAADIDYIYLGQDIVMPSGGAEIPKSKGSLTIDGMGFSLTEYNSLAIGNAIYVQNVVNPAITVTVKNVNWHGYNYYGMIPCYDATSSNVTLIIDNVTYTGPQALYNRQGQTTIRNSSFRIVRTSTLTAPQEFAEINRVVFEGENSVYSEAASDSLIWFCFSNTSMTVRSGARLSLETVSSYVFFSDVSRPAMLVEGGAEVNINAYSGLFNSISSTAHIFSTFTVEDGAAFRAYVATRSLSVPILKCYSALTVGSGADLILVAPLARTSSYQSTLYFGTRATISFNNPHRVILYNNGGVAFRFATGSAASPNVVNVDAELVGLWSSATTPYDSAGGINDVPTLACQKLDGSNITIAASCTTSVVSAITSNIVSGDYGYPLNTASFNILSAAVLSLGRLPLEVDRVTDISTAITGTVEAESELRAEYDAVTINGNAVGTGFSLPISSPIAKGTAITLTAAKSFLRKVLSLVVIGSVSITHLTGLRFCPFVSPPMRDTIYRVNPDWHVEVTDTRDAGAPWYLYITLPTPLTSGSNQLDDVYNLVQEGGGLVTPVPMLVTSGVSQSTTTVTQIGWESVQGPLLMVVLGYPYAGGHYTSSNEWLLTESPL